MGAAKRVAVLTDTVSPDFYFPLWYRYYSALFSPESLYVLTYAGVAKQFGGLGLGGVWEIPFRYEDRQRSETMSAICNALLTHADFVIRCDNDEFLVANPEKFKDLRDYIDNTPLPYVTARGFNVIQAHSERQLDPTRGILVSQRNYVQAVGPMYKTCLTSVPMSWGPGFHWCTAYPQLDDLFLFHFKHADEDMFIDFGNFMAAQVAGNTQFEEYYRADKSRVVSHRDGSFALPLESGMSSMYRLEFDRKFLSTITYTKPYQMYHGQAIYDEKMVEIPKLFDGRL